MLKLKSWIVRHDESNTFIILYITLAVVLSIAISLFWLVVVVAVHFVFECIKQHELKKGWVGVLIRSTWELMLDFGLILFAFVIAIYMDIILGAAGIGAGARAGIQSASKAGTRFAGWQRALRGILLSIDDAAQLTKFSKGSDNESEPVVNSKFGGWTEKWSIGDKFTISFTVLSFLLIVIAPLITNYTMDEIFLVIMQDLDPFP